MKRSYDTILLTAGLISLSLAVLCYNLISLHSDELKAALSESAPNPLSRSASTALELEAALEVGISRIVVSDDAAYGSNGAAADAIAEPEYFREYELLPPIITPN